MKQHADEILVSSQMSDNVTLRYKGQHSRLLEIQANSDVYSFDVSESQDGSFRVLISRNAMPAKQNWFVPFRSVFFAAFGALRIGVKMFGAILN